MRLVAAEAGFLPPGPDTLLADMFMDEDSCKDETKARRVRQVQDEKSRMTETKKEVSHGQA